jgi:hypothetical protein
MPLTDEEKREILSFSELLSPVQIKETLEDLIVREKKLLDLPLDKDMKEITIHNIAVLVAACAGYEAAINNSPESE